MLASFLAIALLGIRSREILWHRLASAPNFRFFVATEAPATAAYVTDRGLIEVIIGGKPKRARPLPEGYVPVWLRKNMSVLLQRLTSLSEMDPDGSVHLSSFDQPFGLHGAAMVASVGTCMTYIDDVRALVWPFKGDDSLAINRELSMVAVIRPRETGLYLSTYARTPHPYSWKLQSEVTVFSRSGSPMIQPRFNDIQFASPADVVFLGPMFAEGMAPDVLPTISAPGLLERSHERSHSTIDVFLNRVSLATGESKAISRFKFEEGQGQPGRRFGQFMVTHDYGHIFLHANGAIWWAKLATG